jgi:TolB-like protein/DNA-binding winged helix-turn-helix (wHTH) protein/Flp pilus assembly protein TadD
MDTNVRREDANSRANPIPGPPPPPSPTAGATRPSTYTFLDVRLDARRQLVLRGAERIRLRPRTYDVLLYLATHAGRVVTKRELVEAVWQGTAVTDDSLVQCLVEIRRALGESHAVVQTVRGRGYLFDTSVGSVLESPSETDLAEATVPSPDQAEDEGMPAEPRKRAGIPLALGASVLVLMIAAGSLGMGYSRWFGGSRPAPSGLPAHSLAVLPLENLSGDPEQDYFADGMTDELITQLANISALRVISRTSVMRFKGTRRPLAEIARELHVDTVVEGTVARSADRVRVTAKLIQVQPESSLLAERYERPVGDVLMLQGALARQIAERIRITLKPEERSRLANLQRVNPDAYEAFLKGRYYWSKRTEESTRKAITYFEQAIDKDPAYGLAYTGLADSQLSLALAEALQEVAPPSEAFPKARAMASRALAIDPSLGEAHASLGHIKFQYDRDWSGAEREFTRAIELSPGYAPAHQWYALSLMWMGRLDEALVEINRARELDPLSLVINANVGFVLAGAHQYDEAVNQCRKTLEMDPRFAQAHYRLGQIEVMRGRYREAIPELQQAVALSGGSPRASAELGLAYALHGDASGATALLSALRDQSTKRYVSPFNMAVIYGGLGDRQHTMEWLDKAYAERSPSLSLLKLSPAFDSVRSDPRFVSLVRRIGLEP